MLPIWSLMAATDWPFFNASCKALRSALVVYMQARSL
jgi:hypothetical protein